MKFTKHNTLEGMRCGKGKTLCQHTMEKNKNRPLLIILINKFIILCKVELKSPF